MPRELYKIGDPAELTLPELKRVVTEVNEILLNISRGLLTDGGTTEVTHTEVVTVLSDMTAAQSDIDTAQSDITTLEGSSHTQDTDSKLDEGGANELTAAEIKDGLAPVGSIVAWSTGTAPTGWLECDGTAKSRTTYADLFAVISDDYGNGDGSTTFNLPDLRGEFIRGYDHGAGTDPDAASRTDRGDSTTGDNVGTKQADGFKSHSHTIQPGAPVVAYPSGGGGYYDFTIAGSNTGATGGNETRPTNVGMMWIIKT